MKVCDLCGKEQGRWYFSIVKLVLQVTRSTKAQRHFVFACDSCEEKLYHM